MVDETRGDSKFASFKKNDHGTFYFMPIDAMVILVITTFSHHHFSQWIDPSIVSTIFTYDSSTKGTVLSPGKKQFQEKQTTNDTTIQKVSISIVKLSTIFVMEFS